MTKWIFGAAVVLGLTACGTTMPTQNTGFLSGYSALAVSEDGSTRTLALRAPLDPARFDVREVEWRVDAGTALAPEERAALLAHLNRALHDQGRTLPAAPGGRPAKVRAAITQVSTVSVGLNTVATVLLIGPLDRGGAAVEMEVIDAETGQQLAALSLGYFAPLSEFKARFNRLEPAKIALTKAAEDLGRLLRSPS